MEYDALMQFSNLSNKVETSRANKSENWLAGRGSNYQQLFTCHVMTSSLLNNKKKKQFKSFTSKIEKILHIIHFYFR